MEIVFLTFHRRKISAAEVEDKIVKWFTITTPADEAFIVATSSGRPAAIVDCTRCRDLRVLEETISPKLVASIDNSVRIVIEPIGHVKRPIVVRF
jgi:hypothetical protein